MLKIDFEYAFSTRAARYFKCKSSDAFRLRNLIRDSRRAPPRRLRVERRAGIPCIRIPFRFRAREELIARRFAERGVPSTSWA